MNGKSSTALQQEAEYARSQLAATLDELRGSVTPGRMFDQVVDYARHSGGADFMHNLGEQVRSNPLPVALIGASIAWLIMSGRRVDANGAGSMRFDGRSRQTADTVMDAARHGSGAITDTARSASDAAGDAARKLGGAASATRAGMADMASGLSQSASNTADSLRRGMHDAQDMMASGVARAGQGMSSVAETVETAGRRLAQGGRVRGGALVQMVQEQPLLLAALGVAVGAALGASLPRTRSEDEYLGPASDALKEQAQETARHQYEQVKETASSTAGAFEESAANTESTDRNSKADATDMKAAAGSVAPRLEEGARDSGDSLRKKAEGFAEGADKAVSEAAGSGGSSGQGRRGSA